MNSPLVSVIVPTRNAEKTAGNAIASVLEQTIPDLELIVVDDASTDRTPAVIAAIDDPRIRLVRNERNMRQAAARNLGWRNARGKWVAFLDADDEWTPDRLETLLPVLEGDENCCVVDLMALAVPGPLGRLVRAKPLQQSWDGTKEDVDLDGILQLGHDVSPILPRRIFGEGGIEFPQWASGGDWVFLFSRLFTRGLRGRLVRRAGYLYRAQAAHDSSTLQAREELLHVLEILASDESLPETSRRLMSKRMAYVREGLVAAALRRRNVGKLSRYAKRYPRSVLALPPRALLFVIAKVRSFLAEAVSSRKMTGDFRI